MTDEQKTKIFEHIVAPLIIASPAIFLLGLLFYLIFFR
jgi:hypothetical protein